MKEFEHELHVYTWFINMLQMLDDSNVRRRFRASNMTCTTKVRPFVCSLPLKLTDGWNNIQINLVELTQRLYATQFIEATRLEVSCCCCCWCG